MLTLLHDPNCEASRAFLALWGNTGPVIANHFEVVARVPNFRGYPTVVYTDAQGGNRTLYSPENMAKVDEWVNQTETPTPRVELTPYEFASRFTLEETAAILALTKTDTMAAAIQKRFDVAQMINLTYQDVQQGLGYFVSKGALTQNRAAAIMATA